MKNMRPIDEPMIHPRPPPVGLPLPRTAVMVQNPGDFARIETWFSKVAREKAHSIFCRQWNLGRIAVVQDICVVAGGFMGSPHAAVICEDLVAGGVRSVIFLGWCGAIIPGLAPGDFVVPGAAFCGDGTSSHYGIDHGQKIPADIKLMEAICARVSAMGKEYRIKNVWTTDAVYRETRSLLESWKKRGAHAVDMELSSVFAVARFKRIRAAGLLIVSDSLAGDRWKPGFSFAEFNEARRLAAEIVVSIAFNQGRENGGDEQ